MIAAGSSAGSVVKKYSSRCVPSRSRTNTQRIGTSPAPDLYQCPVPLSRPTRRVPPPYQATVQPAQPPRRRGGLPGLGQRRPLDPRPALARVRRRRVEQVGVGVELADQRQPAGGGGGRTGRPRGCRSRRRRRRRSRRSGNRISISRSSRHMSWAGVRCGRRRGPVVLLASGTGRPAPAGPRAGWRTGSGRGRPGRPTCGRTARRCRRGWSGPGRGAGPCRRPCLPGWPSTVSSPTSRTGPSAGSSGEEEPARGAAQSQAGPGGGGEDPLVAGAVAGGEGRERCGAGWRRCAGRWSGGRRPAGVAKRWKVGRVKAGAMAWSSGRASGGRIIGGRPWW